MQGTIARVNRYGLREVTVDDHNRGPRRTGFTLNKLAGYRGQPMKRIGKRVSAGVEIEEDNEGRVKSARRLTAGAHAHS